jgi:hypothetical protein
VQPLRWVQAVRDLLIHFCYCRRRYSLRIGQFDTIGRAIDLKKGITAVALMQIMPIGDPHVQETMIGFERTRGKCKHRIELSSSSRGLTANYG